MQMLSILLLSLKRKCWNCFCHITKSTGCDNISAELLKDAANLIVTPLTYIKLFSLKTCKIPNDFKTAQVAPLYKKVIVIMKAITCQCQYYSYGCVHHPWLDDHGWALKDHGRAWIQLKITKSNQLYPAKLVHSMFTPFSVLLDQDGCTCVWPHKMRRVKFNQAEVGPNASSSYFRKSIVF